MNFLKNALRSIKNSKVLQQRISITILIIICYQWLTTIPLPGIKSGTLSNETLQMFGVISGGNYTTLSFMAMGVSPYITANILTEILSNDTNRKMTELSQEGHVGRQKLNNITKILTLIIALIQIPVLLMTFKQANLITNSSSLGTLNYLAAGITMLAGTFIAMTLGDQINRHGIGNGPSLIITANILAMIPSQYAPIVALFKASDEGTTNTALQWCAIMLVGFIIILVMNLTEKRLPLQQLRETKRSSHKAYLPINLNPAGMIPVIIAGGFVSLNTLIGILLTNSGKSPSFTKYLGLDSWSGLLIYGALIFLFGLAYALIQMNPEKLTKHLKQSNTYILGVPIHKTESFLTSQILRVSVIGSLLLTIIAVVPTILGFSQSVQLVSLLIIVSTLVELLKQINGIAKKSNYDTIGL